MRRNSRFPPWARDLYVVQNVQTGSVAHPASYLWATRGFIFGGSAARVWTDHSISSIFEVNEWSYTSTPSYAFMFCTETTLPLHLLKSLLLLLWHAVAQLVEALRYKPEGRGFDSQCFQYNFSLTYSYGPGFDSASNRNEYQVYFLVVKAAGA